VQQSPPSGPLGALFALLLGIRAASDRYAAGKLRRHVFVLPLRGASCQPAAGRLLGERLCVLNTLPDRGVSSSCVHSCNNVISALSYHLLFVWRVVAAHRGCCSLESCSRPLPPQQVVSQSGSREPRPAPRAARALQGLTCASNTTSFCFSRQGDNHDFRQRQQWLFGARKLHGREPGLS